MCFLYSEHSQKKMILLHGGLSLEMMNGFLGGFLGSLALLIALIVYGRKSKFFKEKFVKRETSEKILTCVLFIGGAAFISFISFWFFAFLAAWITSLFT